MLRSALTALIRDNPYSRIQLLSRIKATFYKVIFLSWESIVCKFGTIKFPGHLCLLGKRILMKRSCSLEGEEGNGHHLNRPCVQRGWLQWPQGGCQVVGQRRFGRPQKGRRSLKWSDFPGPSLKLSQTGQHGHHPRSHHFQVAKVAHRINRTLHMHWII